MTDTRIAAARLEALAHALLSALGSAPDEAAVVARHLLEANLRGHDSHGVGMLPFYVDSCRAGTLVPNQPARLSNDAGAILQFAGDRGYGQRVVMEALDLAIERVKSTGILLATVSQSHHMGRIGTYGERLAEAGLVALLFVNVTDFPKALVAPFGGSAARFGTNPICIAFPSGNVEPAFVLDFATSMVAYGKTRVAYLAGRHFDEAVMLDAAGHPTADPKVMWEEPKGALRPIAEHKGGGLVAAVEFLAGLLSSGGTFQPEHPRAGGIVNNLTAVIIDPARVAGTAWLRAEYDAMADYIRSSPSPEGAPPVMLAGEPERQRRAQRLEEGLAFSANEWAGILEAARRAGVAEADLADLA